MESHDEHNHQHNTPMKDMSCHSGHDHSAKIGGFRWRFIIALTSHSYYTVISSIGRKYKVLPLVNF